MIAFRMDRRLLNRVDPSDILQETLILANHRLDKYLREQPIPFYPWLRKLAWDQLVAFHRKHLYAGRRTRRREKDLVPALSDDSVAELASRLTQRELSPSRILVSVWAFLWNRPEQSSEELSLVPGTSSLTESCFGFQRQSTTKSLEIGLGSTR
jgi:DNA-directed RNA polymerase specialized sigma24 family protein